MLTPSASAPSIIQKRQTLLKAQKDTAAAFREEVENASLSTEDMLLLHSPWVSRIRTKRERLMHTEILQRNKSTFATYEHFGVWTGDSTNIKSRELALRRRQRFANRRTAVATAAQAASEAWVTAFIAADWAQSLVPVQLSQSKDQKLLKFLKRRHRPAPRQQERTFS